MAIDPKLLQAAFLEVVAAEPADRAGVLDRVCAGDAELRRRVELLLRAHDDSGELPAAGGEAAGTNAFEPETADAGPTSDLQVGALFAGRYKLREKLGEGGMGVVWVADQIEPVSRRVALKIIKTDVASARLLARFEQERQALALMDHPNIAKVFDAGVVGQDSDPDAPGSDRIGILSHSAGTPYFVMELIKGVPLTKYCDEAKLTPKQRLELFVPVCHAVQHAHQKGIIHRDLKPSNILIGLYDGRPVPKVIDFGVAKATGPQISEHSIYTEVGAMIGTLEYMSPEQAELNNLDIDTRSDIYALGVILYELLTGGVPFSHKELKAAGFAEMLRIIKEVEPPKPSTRLSGSATLPSVAAVRHTEPSKLTRLVRGDLDWITMKCLEKDRTRRYETANGLAMDIQRYLTDEPVAAGPPSAAYRLRKFVRRNRGQVIAASLVFFALLLGMTGTILALIEAKRQERIAFDEMIGKEIARKAEAEQREIAEKKAREAQRAANAERTAKNREADARAKAEKAYERTREVLDSMTSSITGDSLTTQKEITEEQKKFLTEALGYYREFAGAKGDDETSRHRQAQAEYRVGLIEYRLGRNKESVLAYRMACNSYAALVADFSAVPLYRANLAAGHSNLGVLYDEFGKRAEAEEQYRRALEIDAELAHAYPKVPAFRDRLASSHHNLGAMFMDLRKWADAEEQILKALRIREELVHAFPKEPEYLHGLASTYSILGNLLRNLRKGTEAVEQYRQALGIQEDLVKEFPTNPKYREELARSYRSLGLVLRFLGETAEATTRHDQAIKTNKELVDDFQAVPAYRVELGGSYCNKGDLIRNGGEPRESLRWFDLAIKTLQPVCEREPRAVTAKQFLRNSHWNRAVAYHQLQKFAEAVKDWDKTIDLSPLAERPAFRARRAYSRVQAGMVGEAVAEVADLTKSSSWNAGQWYNFACLYAVASGKTADKKQEYADRAMQLLVKAVFRGYNDAAHMKKDTDLDPLRDREDFKKLVAELETKK